MRRLLISSVTCDPAVQRLQLLLNAELRPPPRLYPDGVFGPRTAAALERYQSAYGLTSTGRADEDVWNALGQKAEPAARVPIATNVMATPWMAIAEAELGIEENRLPGKHTDRIVQYHQTTTLKASDDETPWCASFVNWVMIQAGIPGTNSARAISWLRWGTPLSNPCHGAVTVIKKKGGGPDAQSGSSSGNHVGFCVSATQSAVRILGGNQGGGRKVCVSNYPFEKFEILGYRWPFARGAR